MQLAPLQLNNYRVHYISIRALPGFDGEMWYGPETGNAALVQPLAEFNVSTFDASEGKDLDLDGLSVDAKCLQPIMKWANKGDAVKLEFEWVSFDTGEILGELIEGDARMFAVHLTIQQEALPGKNLPYAYELEMSGQVLVHPNFPLENVRQAVETNGPSLLFGAAREILRAATAFGPYGPILIPSVTFFRPPPLKSPASKAPKKKKAQPRKSGKTP